MDNSDTVFGNSPITFTLSSSRLVGRLQFLGPIFAQDLQMPAGLPSWHLMCSIHSLTMERARANHIIEGPFDSVR